MFNKGGLGRGSAETDGAVAILENAMFEWNGAIEADGSGWW